MMVDKYVLPHYLDDAGRVTRWPGKRYLKAVKPQILDYLAGKFDADRRYTEREVNDTLNMWHTFGDWALLRRELFMHGYLRRLKDGSAYWRSEKETGKLTG